MTADQLDASAKDPWTSTIVGLGVGAALAGRAATAPRSTATSRPMIHAGTLRRLVVMERNMAILSADLVVSAIIFSPSAIHRTGVAPGPHPGLAERARARVRRPRRPR